MDTETCNSLLQSMLRIPQNYIFIFTRLQKRLIWSWCGRKSRQFATDVKIKYFHLQADPSQIAPPTFIGSFRWNGLAECQRAVAGQMANKDGLIHFAIEQFNADDYLLPDRQNLWIYAKLNYIYFDLLLLWGMGFPPGPEKWKPYVQYLKDFQTFLKFPGCRVWNLNLNGKLKDSKTLKMVNLS